MKTLCLLAVLAGAVGITALATDPVPLQQPTLAINYLIRIKANSDSLGDIIPFAGGSLLESDNVVPAHGQILAIADNVGLFSKIGTNYGGDGQSTFALPDLRGRSVGGRGASFAYAGTTGNSSVTLQPENLPPSLGGTSVPVTRISPTIGLSQLVRYSGFYPSGGTSVEGDLIGEIRTSASFASPPAGSQFYMAEGQPIPSSDGPQITVFFTYFQKPGSRPDEFYLPDLRDRVTITQGMTPGTLGSLTTGQIVGSNSFLLTDDVLPGAPSQMPILTYGASIALNYGIVVEGIHPNANDAFSDYDYVIGQIVPFAFDLSRMPSNIVPLDGRLLSVSTYPALFSVIGTTYGGDGRSNFAVPDARGRTLIGATGEPGILGGITETFLTSDQIPLSPPSPPLLSNARVLHRLKDRLDDAQKIDDPDHQEEAIDRVRGLLKLARRNIDLDSRKGQLLRKLIHARTLDNPDRRKTLVKRLRNKLERLRN